MIPLPTLTDDLESIGQALDAHSHDERVNWMRGLSGGQLAALYKLAEGRGPVDLDFFAGTGEGEVVIHHGQNSLPFFNAFQKRFVRRGGIVQGYNHNPPAITRLIGPGHFVSVADGDEVVVDYTRLPPDVPEGFPALIDNESGVRKLVFGNLSDRLRRVSRHCTIGSAWRSGKPMKAWFMLTREGDPQA